MEQKDICGYNIDRRVGRGSYGTVIKVTDEDQKDIAFKVIKGSNEIGVPSVLEIDIMTRFEHPYLVHAFDIYTPITCPDLTGSSVGISMPLARTDLGIIFHPDLILEKLVNRHPDVDLNSSLTFEMRLALIWQILQGVLFLHQMNIYHLDLKPWNILLYGTINDPEDLLIAKISDFGLAYYCPFPIKGCPDLKQRFTSAYRAPELFQKISYSYSLDRLSSFHNRYLYNEKSDVWSIGMIIGEIITGKRMIQVSSTKGLDRFINVIFSPENIDNYLDNFLYYNSTRFDKSMEMIKDIIKGCLSINPANRPSISEILENPIFQPFQKEEISPIIYDPIIGPMKEINYPGYKNGIFVIEDIFRSIFFLDDIGTFFLTVDIYYRALSFFKNIDEYQQRENIQKLKDNALLIAGASILLARGFYDIKTDLYDILSFTDLTFHYSTENLYEMEQNILNLFGYIVYRPYIYEKAPNIEVLLSSYSLLLNPNYLDLNLDTSFSEGDKYHLNQPSKQMSVMEYFHKLLKI